MTQCYVSLLRSALLSDLSGVRGGVGAGARRAVFDRDNKCYHECEAEEYGGNILQTDRHKGVMDG